MIDNLDMISDTVIDNDEADDDGNTVDMEKVSYNIMSKEISVAKCFKDWGAHVGVQDP